jgi:membrane protease YdiL (CAAX protease family)
LEARKDAREDKPVLRRNSPYVVGFLGSIALVLSILIFMYCLTFSVDNGLILSAVAFILVGVLFSYVTVGLRFEPFQVKGFVETVMWTVGSFVAIWIANHVVPIRFEALPIDGRMFAVLMGVAEECFFRLFLCTFVQKVTRSTLLSVVTSSLIWSVYHIGRYGGNVGALFVIFLCGLVLGFVMLQTRKPDSPMFAHGVVNYLAYSG